MRCANQHKARDAVQLVTSLSSSFCKSQFRMVRLPTAYFRSQDPVSVRTLTAPRRFYTSLSRSLHQSWKRNAARPWMCPTESCRSINRGGEQECATCGSKKPQLLGWKCVGCGTENFAGVKACKKCSDPADKSRNFWMCAVCHENNRVDEIEDNSRCGFCGYDMAPPSVAEEEILRRAQEHAESLQQQQENFDSISVKEADEQFNDPLHGADVLNPALQAAHRPSEWSRRSPILQVPKVIPFTPNTKPETRHSCLHRRKNIRTDIVAAINAEETPAGPPGFDWMCRASDCGHINPGDEEACMKCGVHIVATEWECQLCAALNHLSRSRCFSCRSRIPVCWTCGTCHTTTSIYDKACRNCAMDRPTVSPKTPREVEENHRTSDCSVTQQGDRKRGDWYCPACSSMNFSRRQQCFQCGQHKPADAEATSEDAFQSVGWGDGGSDSMPRSTTAHNNWICSQCQTSNFRTRRDCWKCGTASERAGDWSGDANAPQFEREGFLEDTSGRPAEGHMNSSRNTDDQWTCAKCYAKNFRRRSECFRCGMRKMALGGSARHSVRKPVKL